MKELETIHKDEAPIQAEIKKEVKLIGNQLSKPGLTLFECNIISGEIVPAKYLKVDAEFKSKKSMEIRKSVLTKENCVYIQALNKKNASKKFNKLK